MKRYLSIALAASMLFAMSGCGNSAATADTEATTAAEETTEAAEGETSADVESAEMPTLSQDTIVIGLDDEFPPMGFRDENNEIVGFDIDLAKAVGEKLGVEVQFHRSRSVNAPASLIYPRNNNSFSITCPSR